MKIITHGIRNKGVFPYNAVLTCPHCSCRFQLEPGDWWSRESDGRNGEYVQATCPDCRQPVTLTPSAGTRWGGAPTFRTVHDPRQQKGL